LDTAIKHPVPDRVKPSFVIFDILTFKAELQSARMSKITNGGLTRYRLLPRMATVGVKGIGGP